MSSFSLRRLTSLIAAGTLLAVATQALSSHVVSAKKPTASGILQHTNQVEVYLAGATGIGTSRVRITRKSGTKVQTLVETGNFKGEATTAPGKKAAFKESLSLSEGKTQQSKTLEYVAIGSSLASKAPTAKTWVCGKTADLNHIQVWTPVSFSVKSVSAKGKPKLAGSATFKGRPVWKLVYSSSSKKKGYTSNLSATVLVDKQKYTILHMTDTSRTSGHGASEVETNSVTFSAYGKPMRVKMPSCAQGAPGQ